MPKSIGNIFELALESIDQGVVIYDHDLNVLAFNNRALDILELPPAQLSIGDSFSKWVRLAADQGSYGGQGTADERFEKRMAIARSFAPYRVCQPRYNGRIVEVIGKPLADIGYVTTYTDITERVLAERTTQQSQQRFRDFAELGSDWFWEMGPDLKFTYHSKRYFEITGFRPEDKIGTSRTRYVAPDMIDSEKDKWAAHMADLAARRPFRNFEYEFVAHDGRSILARITGTPIFGPSGEFLGYRGIGTDITDIMKSAKALRQTEEQFRAFIDNLPSFINLKDKDGRYLIINRKYTEIFGFNQQGVVGKVISEFLPEKHSDDASVQEREVITTKSVITHERQMQVEGGEAREFLVTKFPIFDDKGNVARIGTIGTDITDRKEAEAALIAAKAAADVARMEAEAANRGKSDFLASMSHDLRTPLNAIIGFADAISLQYFGPINDKYQDYASDIRWSGEHLLSLIGDILDVTAIEAGMLNTHMQYLQIADTIEECRMIIKSEARTNGVDLTVSVPEDLPLVYADKQAIKKIILNLLANAIKFTQREGLVTLTAKATDQAHILEISDTGIGIPEDQLAQITDPFVKGVSNPYQSHDGVGLGLAIVKSLVLAHNGLLDIKSKPGKGTTITVTLPRGDV